MIPLSDALRLLDDRVQPLAPVHLDLPQAIGCRLAETVRAIIDVPRADVSVMDGYAIRAADTGRGSLPIAFEIQAGATARELPAGSAARIFTGAELPRGADAVVPQEDAQLEEASLFGANSHSNRGGTARGAHVALPACAPGDSVRKTAEVCRAGDELAPASAIITPQLAGLLAAAGPSQIGVIPQPRLAILTTGSELVSTHHQPRPGQIRDSNAVMLAALASDAHLQPRMFERVPDKLETLRNAILAAMERADVVITSGGVAVGNYDFVPQLVTELGAEIIFRKVAIKPGKPILIARLGAKWFAGLPGNPLSAFVGWHLFIKPMLDRLAGNRSFSEPAQSAQLSEPVRNPANRLELSCGIVDFNSPTKALRLLKWKGSHDVVTLAKANALIEIPAHSHLPAGQRVTVHRV